MSYFPQSRPRRLSRPSFITLIIFVLILGGIWYWLFLPHWQARLLGVQTKAIAHADGIQDRDYSLICPQ